MKKILMLGTAFVMLGAATDAHAQDRLYSSSKDSDRVLSDTRYQQRAPVVEQRTTAEQAAVIEPAAGDRYANFTGPYIGGQVGYTTGSAEVENLAVPDGDVGLDGFNYGVFAGFGFAQNITPLLGGYAGIEVGYDWSESNGTYAGTGFEKETEILVTFRPGVTFNEDVLGYGIIGWSRGEFEGAGDDDNLDGLVLGAGTEIGMGMPLRLRAELTYTNWESGNIGGAGFDPHDTSVKVGALFRF